MEKQKVGRPRNSGKGYCWHQNAKSWMVRINIEGKRIATYYKLESDAIRAVAAARANIQEGT